MVEGHQCHRVAQAHRKLLLGKSFQASSPNGRFIEGAAAIDSQVLTRIEVHGKNLFYFFGSAESSPVVVHIHFGMSGAFRTAELPGPDPTETTRLTLVNRNLGVIALLSAMTVDHGTLELYEEKCRKLGPDPLREDADKALVWAKVSRSKKSIGLLLMDQSVVAGIGNIYRAEILFKAGVHPEQPGQTLDEGAFDRIWYHSVSLLQRGYVSGSILTVDPDEAKKLGNPWTRRYIYNQKQCGRCRGVIRTWDMGGRTAYACEGCQPLGEGTQLTEGRRGAMKGAVEARQFRSHCAPESADSMPLEHLTLAELRQRLVPLKLDTKGRKGELLERLRGALSITSPSEGGGAVEEAAKQRERGGAGAGEGEGNAGTDDGRHVTSPRSARQRLAVKTSMKSVTPVTLVTPAPAAVRRGTHYGQRRLLEASRGGDDGKDAVDVAEDLLSSRMAVPGLNSASHSVPETRLESPSSTGLTNLADLTDLKRCTAAQLRARLQELSLPLQGRKADLIARLVQHSATTPAATPAATPTTAGPSPLSAAAASAAPAATPAATSVAAGPSPLSAAAPSAPTPAASAQRLRKQRSKTSQFEDIAPGIQGLGPMLSAKEAALEKLLAGESRAVEHVALHDGATDGLLVVANAGGKRTQRSSQSSPKKPQSVLGKRRHLQPDGSKPTKTKS